MSEKRVTVSLVWVQEDTCHGTIVHKSTEFRLPGADYSQTCEALRSAGFEWVDTVQEAIEAKLAEGREEKRMSEKRVTVSLVQITQETRPEGLVFHTDTHYCLPRADYSQICAALLAAKFELVATVQEAIDAKLAEGCNE